MKKSKIVGIGLLALSIVSCRSTTHKDREKLEDQGTPNYYIDNGAGYNHGGISPIWIYYMMGYNNGRTVSYPTYVHRSYGRNGTYHATNFGSRSSITSRTISRSSASHATRSSVSRGGFGHSTASHSSSGGRSSAS